MAYVPPLGAVFGLAGTRVTTKYFSASLAGV
jgi:hypothetical protein